MNESLVVPNLFDDADESLVVPDLFDDADESLVVPDLFDEKEKELSTSGTIHAAGLKALDGVAFGFGDEISAGLRVGLDELVRTVAPDVVPTGTASERYQRYLSENRKVEKKFEEEDPMLAAGIEIGTSLIPAFKLSTAVGNMATRLGNIGVQSGLGGGEMLVREFAEGEGSAAERAEAVDWNVVGAGAIFGALGGSLMRGQESVEQLAKLEAASRTEAGNVTEAGLNSKSRFNAKVRHIRDDLYANVREEVGAQPARAMSAADAQSMQWKQAIHNEENLPIKKLDALTKVFKASGKASKLVADAGAVKKVDDGFTPVFSPAGRQKRLDMAAEELNKIDPEAAKTFTKMRSTMELVQSELKRVFPQAAEQFEAGYHPLYGKREASYKGFMRRGKRAKTDASTVTRTTGFISEKQAIEAFDDPVSNFMAFYEDTVDALALARSFNVKVQGKTLDSIQSYTDEVIKAIEKNQAKELGKDGAKRLADNLRLFAIDGRESMSSFANIMRTASHAALLGTPENAVLQAGDLGQAAYATSFKSAIKALPKALKSVLLTDGDMVVSSKGYEGILRMADLGLTRQHLTEMVNQNKHWLPRNVSKLADLIMTGTGVRKANRLGVETNINGQIYQMRSLANKGIDALAKSDYAEGLTEQQIQRLYDGIKSGNVKDKAIREAVFFKLSRFQPISRTSMPPAYLEARNGRLLWSMRMYMTKMASKFNEDVLVPTYQAERAGLNTAKGRRLLGKALLNTGRYTSFILSLNAIVDPGRKEMFRGKESPNDFGEELFRQGMSFASGGLFDPNLVKYGMSPSETLIPPAISAGGSAIELGMKALMGEEITPAQMRRAAMFIPGVRQQLWFDEVAEEHNL